jgi:hypothetical protein
MTLEQTLQNEIKDSQRWIELKKRILLTNAILKKELN